MKKLNFVFMFVLTTFTLAGAHAGESPASLPCGATATSAGSKVRDVAGDAGDAISRDVVTPGVNKRVIEDKPAPAGGFNKDLDV